MRGAAALPVTWKRTPHDDLTNAQMRNGLNAEKCVAAKQWGDAKAGLRGAARYVEADYEVPFIAHTPMEPFNINVHIQGDLLEIWAPTQNQDRLLSRVARATGWPAERIRLHTMLQGGGYGRRLHEDIAPSTVIIAKAVGKPVKLFWAREDG